MAEPHQAAMVQETDLMLHRLELAEKRVVTASFLLAKIFSVRTLLIGLLLSEAAVVRRLWEAEFASRSEYGYPSAIYLIPMESTRPQTTTRAEPASASSDGGFNSPDCATHTGR